MRGGTGCIVKYVPHSNQTSCVGSQFATEGLDWVSGVLAMDGVIYCIPTDAKRILAIDPIGEFWQQQRHICRNTGEFGYFFQTIKADYSDRNLDDDSIVELGSLLQAIEADDDSA